MTNCVLPNGMRRLITLFPYKQSINQYKNKQTKTTIPSIASAAAVCLMELKNDDLSFVPNPRTFAICIFLLVSITSALSFGHQNATTAPQTILPTNISDQKSNSPTSLRLPTAVRSEPNTTGTASTCNQTKTEGGGAGKKSIRWTTTFIQLVMIVLIVGICLFCALDSAMYGLIRYVRTWRPVGGGGGIS